MESLHFWMITSDSGFPSQYPEDEVVDFLFHHLDPYGDPKDQIMRCVDYALARNGKSGGFVLLAIKDQQLAGVTVINHTGMDGYIPSNILVYIAVDAKWRGQGIGAGLMQEALQHCTGGVALHVEPDNPAKRLYERLGFTHKYLEMRHP